MTADDRISRSRCRPRPARPPHHAELARGRDRGRGALGQEGETAAAAGPSGDLACAQEGKKGTAVSVPGDDRAGVRPDLGRGEDLPCGLGAIRACTGWKAESKKRRPGLDLALDMPRGRTSSSASRMICRPRRRQSGRTGHQDVQAAAEDLRPLPDHEGRDDFLDLAFDPEHRPQAGIERHRHIGRLAQKGRRSARLYGRGPRRVRELPEGRGHGGTRSWTSSTRRTKPLGGPEYCRRYPRVQVKFTPQGPE